MEGASTGKATRLNLIRHRSAIDKSSSDDNEAKSKRPAEDLGSAARP